MMKRHSNHQYDLRMFCIVLRGFIECNELEAALKTLGVTLSQEQVRSVFKAADLNGA
jgi:Ca2+-binding EF-hand superfamily protein